LIKKTIASRGGRSSKLFWTLAKSAESEKSLNSLKKKDGTQTLTPEETIERAKSHFEDLLKEPPNNSSRPKKAKVKQDTIPICAQHRKSLTKQFTVKTVQAAIKKMKGGKAAGPDGIPNEFIKAGGTPLAISLTDLFNRIL
jgi:hypothetical protein